MKYRKPKTFYLLLLTFLIIAAAIDHCRKDEHSIRITVTWTQPAKVSHQQNGSLR
jgi:hypothetical protein